MFGRVVDADRPASLMKWGFPTLVAGVALGTAAPAVAVEPGSVNLEGESAASAGAAAEAWTCASVADPPAQIFSGLITADANATCVGDVGQMLADVWIEKYDSSRGIYVTVGFSGNESRYGPGTLTPTATYGCSPSGSTYYKYRTYIELDAGPPYQTGSDESSSVSINCA
ncbi:hypothetical protein UG55_11442 [Frankia sp. EI5c]|nr:hypothetical protein UG55_11442 [Frankia sp. EI5c]